MGNQAGGCYRKDGSSVKVEWKTGVNFWGCAKETGKRHEGSHAGKRALATVTIGILCKICVGKMGVWRAVWGGVAQRTMWPVGHW